MQLGGTTVTERQLQHLIGMSEREREEACPTSPGRSRLTAHKAIPVST
ncbi:hypothetical protein [Streptomyces aureus]|uniref:Transposase n=1 Tax=Streptomyces aureus TaxID=193461 RepID=A0ABV4SPD8_9ACTN